MLAASVSSRDTHLSDGFLHDKRRIGMRSSSRPEPCANAMTYSVCFGEISVAHFLDMASDVHMAT
jgi:hypothetical protein